MHDGILRAQRNAPVCSITLHSSPNALILWGAYEYGSQEGAVLEGKVGRELPLPGLGGV